MGGGRGTPAPLPTLGSLSLLDIPLQADTNAKVYKGASAAWLEVANFSEKAQMSINRGPLNKP